MTPEWYVRAVVTILVAYWMVRFANGKGML